MVNNKKNISTRLITKFDITNDKNAKKHNNKKIGIITTLPSGAIIKNFPI